ncbi:MAG: ABC transporter ATP-binding protein [Candidatus Hydrogenedentota bacterium]
MGIPVARLERVSKRYGSRTALSEVSLEIAGGEVLALAGQNGAGKTTAIRTLLGLVHPDSGAGHSPSSRPGQRMGGSGYLPEESSPFPNITARELLNTVLTLSQVDAAERHARADRLLDRCGIMEAADLRAGAFSKGMLRRLGFAMALAGDPELLVLDEPQSGLDPIGREDFAALIKAERAKGRAVLLASHDLAEIDDLADRVLLLHRGRIIGERRAEDPPGTISVSAASPGTPRPASGSPRFPGIKAWFLDSVRKAENALS